MSDKTVELSGVSRVASSESTLQREFVEQLAFRKMRGFQGTIDKNGIYLDSVYKSNRSLSQSIASDYRDRFLVELIQNAYDAHPVGTVDGQIDITFDKRWGEFGKLFIANKGSPFEEVNVESLCDIGLSQKPLDVSIGNKGLGFRSVVQISDAPKVYSQHPNAPNTNQFYGFCFRFAGQDDYSDLITDPKIQELARRDLPMFHIPVNIDDQSDVVCRYAKDGFSTVIEVPLKDVESQESVQLEIKRLGEQSAPMLLFLNRVESLTVRTVDKTGQDETRFELTRKEEDLEANGIELYRVSLGGVGQFLVARQSVSESAMQDAIQKGKGDLNEYWNRWTGEGEVSIAVRLDSFVESPRLYTFLPMGEQAATPFQGFLHGSFSPDSSRKSLDGRIQLNALLLKKAIILAARTIHCIVAHSDSKMAGQLTAEECAKSVVDLLCWTKVDSLQTDEDFVSNFVRILAAEFKESCFNAVPVVPCLLPERTGGKLIWQTPAHARKWPNESDMFADTVAAQFAAKSNIWPIWNVLGRRIDILDTFLSMHANEYGGAPSGKERGQLVTQVAKKLNANRRALTHKWQEFYQDLPEFMGNDGKYLSGLSILICNDDLLHKAMSEESSEIVHSRSSRRRKRSVVTAVFSPPDPRRSSANDDLEVNAPKVLSERFSFLNSMCSWHGELSDARKYLEIHQLVREFDREAVLSQLSRTLRAEKNKKVLRGGLRWAFQLWRQPRSHGRSFKLQAQHRFKVPTLSGDYVEAGDSVFSANWPDKTVGKLLQEFLDSAPTGIPELEGIANRRLAKPDDQVFRFRGEFVDDWVLFLEELGVKRGLTPEWKSIKTAVVLSNNYVSNFSFLEDCGIPLEIGQFWHRDISTEDRDLLSFDYSKNYEIEGKVTWLPGQSDIEHFTSSCKECYAKLILLWLSKKSIVPWSVTIRHRVYHRAESRQWPTPLKSFLRSACWLPVDDPAVSNSCPVEVRPRELWVNLESDNKFESFLRRPTRDLLRYFNIESDVLIENLRKHCNLRIFYVPEFLPDQIEFLSHQFVSDGFVKYFEPHLLNIYDSTWQRFADHFNREECEIDFTNSPTEILVQRGDGYELMSMIDQDDEEGECIYVCDANRESDSGLLRASGRAFFCLRDRDSEGHKVGKLFSVLFKQRVRCLSQVTYKLLADERSIESCAGTSVLEICPQLRTMVATAMEALSGTEAQRLPSDREKILTKLKPLKFIKASRLKFVIDGMDVSMRQDKCQAFHFKFSDDQSVIAVQSSQEFSEKWTWELIDISILAICEALDGLIALAPHLRLLIMDLRHREPLQDCATNPADDVQKFSSILQLSPTASQAARASLSAGESRYIQWIRATLHLLLGNDAVAAFDNASQNQFDDINLLQNILSQLLKNSIVSADEVFNGCRAALKAADVRKSLGFEFNSFNNSLLALNLDPETYPNDHKLQLENFILENEVKIIDCLRTSCAIQLINIRPAKDYSDKRDRVRNLEPDPEWLVDFEVPPNKILIEFVDAWLANQKAPPLLGLQDNELEPLILVRENNQKLIQSFVKKALPLVQAWCRKHQQPENQIAMMDMEDGPIEIRRQLDDAGVFDFKTLDESKLMEWLLVLNLWPPEMALSLDINILGLSQDDLADSTKETERKEAQEREARIIPFNGGYVDPISTDILIFSEELRDSLSPQVLRKKLGSFPDLVAIGDKPNSNGRGGNGSASSRVPRMHEVKAQFIGRLGEVVVYYWLRNILPQQDINAAWKSENRSHITGCIGDDTLGYDFAVSYNNQIWQIEVKASLDDPRSFILNETEVRAAREAARSRSGTQYKIVYVSNLSNTSKTNIEILPNPMTKEGGDILQLRGEGIRYGFVRE